MSDDPQALGRALLAAWSGPDTAGPDHLGCLVQQAQEQGHERWPDVEVDGCDFARFIARRLPADRDPTSVLPQLRAEDLYLACACRHGSEHAASRFRSYVLSTVRRAVARVAPDAADDVIHRLYDRLFLESPGAAAKIEGYKGTGDLRRWVSVVACRIAIDGRRKETAERLRIAAFGRLAQHAQTLELDYLRQVYRDEFRDAFTLAIETLDERQRNVLRYQLEGLTADQVGRLYNVHRVTVARWLSRIRERLFEQTRSALRAQLNLDDNLEADSILRLVEGQVSLSLDRLLASRS